MKQPLKELNNLNALKNGLSKQWIWGNKDNHFHSCDILQKVNYCIQDLNREIESLAQPTMKEIVYTIVLVDWIREAVEALPEVMIPRLLDSFAFAHENQLTEANKYFKAIRSFSVAHPLTTDRHPQYGLDGDKICVDIRHEASMARFTDDHWFMIDFNGFRKAKATESADYVLYIYSYDIDGMQFFQYVKANVCDLFRVAELNIEKLYAMDKYLSKLRKKDWINNEQAE